MQRRRKKRTVKRPMSLKGRLILYGLIVLVIGALGFCAYKIGYQLYDYHHSNQMYEWIEDKAVVENDGSMVSDAPSEEIDTTDLMGIDWESFGDVRPVAWVQLGDTVSYPVYHDDGSQFYLRHLPDGTYATAGSIFLYGENSGTFTDQSSFIYGHNMVNGSMFGSLKYYTDSSHSNDRFYLYLPDGTRHIYQFFAVLSVSETSKAYTWSFANSDSFVGWQQWLKENSMLDCPTEVDASARYVTLSTCNGSHTSKRLIIVGQEVKVDQVQEPASWYDEYAAQLSQQQAQRKEVGEARVAELNGVQEAARKRLYDERRGGTSEE